MKSIQSIRNHNFKQNISCLTINLNIDEAIYEESECMRK